MLNLFSSHQTVEIPAGHTEIVVSEAAPGPADQDKVWLKIDGTGDPVNFYWFNGGSWKEVNPPNVFWGIASNVLNAYSLAVAKPPPALVTGQLYLFKVPTANTGAATLQVNAFGAFAFNAAGLPLVAGQLVVNAYIGAIWTGTTFELMGAQSSQIAVSQLIPGTEGQRVTTTSAVAVWQGGFYRFALIAVPTVSGVTDLGLHGLGVQPDLVYFYLECTVANNGFTVGERIDVQAAYTTVSSNDKKVLQGSADATNARIARYVPGGGFFVLSNSTGIEVDISGVLAADWKLGCNLWVF
jgi:hypothetical protein